MNFELSEDQRILQQSAQAFARRQSPPGRLRQLREDPLGFSRALWRQMAELGWLGLLLPEEVGGVGASFVDAAVLLEQLGAALVPEPFVPSVVVAGTAIRRGGSAEQRQRWLAPLCAGQLTLALAYAEARSRFNPCWVETRAARREGGHVLSGQKVLVLGGHAADHLVVSARTAGGAGERGGVSLFVLDRDMPGVTIRQVRTMDGPPAALVTLDGVAADAARLLGEEGEAAALLEEVLDLGAAAACAEGVGVTAAVLEMTCEYLRTREQFGVKIGGFQALQHRAVDMFIETELCRSMALLASIRCDEGDAEARRAAVSAAKVQLCRGGRLVTQQAIQLHGGIGVTDEHDVGLYFKRMHALCTLWGDEAYHTERMSAQPAFLSGIG